MDLSKLLAPKPAPTKPRRPLSMLLLSPAGFGKSSFAAQWPKPKAIIHPRDSSILDLMEAGLIPEFEVQVADTWPKALMYLDETANEKCKTVIAESLTFFTEMASQHCCSSDFGGDFANKAGWLNFQDGPRTTANKYWTVLMDKLARIHDSGKHFIMTGHTDLKGIRNPRGNDYDADVPYCPNPIWAMLHPIMKCVCHIQMEVELQKDKSTKPNQKVKAAGDRLGFVMYPTPTIKGAKNKWGINHTIFCGQDAQKSYQLFTKEVGLNPETGFKI